MEKNANYGLIWWLLSLCGMLEDELKEIDNFELSFMVHLDFIK